MSRIFVVVVGIVALALAGCVSDEPCSEACESSNAEPGAEPVDCARLCSASGGETPRAKAAAANYCLDNPQACLNKAAD